MDRELQEVRPSHSTSQSGVDGGMTKKRKTGTTTRFICNRIETGTLPNIAIRNIEHDLEIPEGYVAEIWGCEIQCNGFLDTGGVLEYFLSLDEDVTTVSAARASDDVVFAGGFETLLVTTGGGMVHSRDRVFFPFPFVVGRDIIAWVINTETNWSTAYGTVAIFYKLRKATDKDIMELLLRRR